MKDGTVAFFDDFTGAELDRDSWNVAVPGDPVNDELQAYCDTAETVRIAREEDGIADCNGALLIQPRYRPGFTAPGGRTFDFISGRINTRAKVELTYGTRVGAHHASRRRGSLAGVLGTRRLGPLAGDGEIDVMENVGEPDWVSAALHGPGYAGETALVNRIYFPDGSDASAWHVYQARWEPRVISFAVDGMLLVPGNPTNGGVFRSLGVRQQQVPDPQPRHRGHLPVQDERDRLSLQGTGRGNGERHRPGRSAHGGGLGPSRTAVTIVL